MNDLEFRIRVQGMVKQLINQLMQSNNISATVMEDALMHTVAELREVAMVELINAQDLEKQETQEEDKKEPAEA